MAWWRHGKKMFIETFCIVKEHRYSAECVAVVYLVDFKLYVVLIYL